MMMSVSVSAALAAEIQSTSSIDPYIYELIDSYEIRCTQALPITTI